MMMHLDMDANCVFLHLDEVSQDHSGESQVWPKNWMLKATEEPCTSAQQSNYLAIFLFSLDMIWQDIKPAEFKK